MAEVTPRNRLRARPVRRRVWRRGGAVLLRLWPATVAARAGTDVLGAVAWHQPFRIRALYLGFGVTLGLRHTVTSHRAGRLGTAISAGPGLAVRSG